MPRYIVTYTSMVIEADNSDDAISYAMDASGGNWEAEEVTDETDYSHRPTQ